MHFKLPPIDPTLTFQDQDIFQRRDFAKSLSKIVTSTTDSLVISLESQWGDGKTSFVHKWLNDLRANQNNVPCLYIDAYKNDFQNDPFLLISAEIYTYAAKKISDGAEATTSFANQVKEVSGAITKGTLKTAITFASGGFFADEQFDNLEKNIGAELGKISDKYVDDALKKHAEKNKTIEDLKTKLSELARALGDNKPLVVVIDELDRCRPTFALEFLETIKHLFSAEHVIFVLVNNPDQLEESVRAQYGRDVDAGGYLRKFYDLSFSLPKGEDFRITDSELHRFTCEVFEHIYGELSDTLESWAYMISMLSQRLSLSLRDIQKICLILSIAQTSSSYRRDDYAINTTLHVGLAVIALKDRELLKDLYQSGGSWLQFKEFFKCETLDDTDEKHFDEIWHSVLDPSYTISIDLEGLASYMNALRQQHNFLSQRIAPFFSLRI
ncbi:P-loop NTPase fold protein [Pontibacterium granulatum]|uniref:KAP family P-loop NTPase fold protein n=1 Tax=Pontibacterium granulatum TaxID=2036029 RepID=UPI00249C1B95|nr:P-loop NTPase fold protein [Pontibacterium granulatum]MDI3326772.1 P-loop NTPase fold protein [Pontibacterium granulatum]